EQTSLAGGLCGPGVGHARVWTRVAAGCGHREAAEVVCPAADVPGPLLGRQVTVLKLDPGTAAFGGEPDLDRAGPGRQPARAGVAPADQQAARRVEAQEAAADRRTLDVYREPAARLGLEQGVLAHPGDDRRRPGEVLVDPLRRRLDVHGGDDRFSHHRRTLRLP